MSVFRSSNALYERAPLNPEPEDEFPNLPPSSLSVFEREMVRQKHAKDCIATLTVCC
jgi:hypothetical protein